MIWLVPKSKRQGDFLPKIHPGLSFLMGRSKNHKVSFKAEFIIVDMYLKLSQSLYLAAFLCRYHSWRLSPEGFLLPH